MFGWDTLIYLMIASMVIQAIITPKANIANPKPEAFNEIDFPQADEGTPQAVIFGDCWTEDWMVLTVGNYRTTEIKSDQGGGK